MQNWVRWLLVAMLVVTSITLTLEFKSLRNEIWYALHATQVNEIRAKLIEIWVAQHVSTSPFTTDSLLGANPVRLLNQPPDGYIGEFNAPPNEYKDAWFFNLKTRCLVHVSTGREQLGYRLEAITGRPAAGIGMIGSIDLVHNKQCEINNK